MLALTCGKIFAPEKTVLLCGPWLLQARILSKLVILDAEWINATWNLGSWDRIEMQMPFWKFVCLLLRNFNFSYLNSHKKIRAEILLDSKKTTKLGKFGFMSMVFGKFRSFSELAWQDLSFCFELITRWEITFKKLPFFMFLAAKCSGWAFS